MDHWRGEKMKRNLIILGILTLIVSTQACTLTLVDNAIATDNPAPLPDAVIGEPPALVDSIQFVSITPAAADGLRYGDLSVTAVVQVNLVTGPGSIVMFFERFHDAACTDPGFDPSGNSTMNSSEPLYLEIGSQQVTVTAAAPPLDIEFVGVGFQIWAPGNASILAELYYPVCYQVMY
jgi:hypothetical protein